MITELFSSFSSADFPHNISLLELTICSLYNWTSSKFLIVSPSKAEFLLVGLPQQLSKLSSPMIHPPNNVTLLPIHSAHNLGVIFDSNLTFSEHISTVSKSCFYHIRDLRRIRTTMYHITACTVASSVISYKLDYCSSLLLNIPSIQTKRLQLVLNAAALAVTKLLNFITFFLFLNLCNSAFFNV
jgi:hypothetical protein